MRTTFFICLCFVVSGLKAAPFSDDSLDRLDDALTWSGDGDRFRARLSGSLEMEDYQLDSTPIGLVHTDGNNLINPRLVLFLDAQAGAHFYFFAQSRLDRGFDPGDGNTQLRLDEYALRFTPFEDGRLNFQIGKFSTVVGNWTERHLAWDNPFITAPLPYENFTGIFDGAAADSPATLLRWAHVTPSAAGSSYIDQYRLPILWGPSYTSGAAVSGGIGKFSYAMEFKNASLSSRPGIWDASQVQWQNPTISGRLGYQPDESWKFGVSFSSGTYLNNSARPTLAPGTDFGDYREIVFGQDISYAWHHFQFWAEAFEARFQVPRVGDARTFAYYLEAKYKFTPQFFGAVRWNQQLYGRIPDGTSSSVRWGQNTWRIDLGPGYRFSSHTELKLQYSLQSGGVGSQDLSQTLATQFVLRF
ncbi:MAG TPA: hypothetical protein VGM64_04415 [Lacunisphaera sp.]|jgi:hypothetical protein